jgi:hypothetical protein
LLFDNTWILGMLVIITNSMEMSPSWETEGSLLCALH